MKNNKISMKYPANFYGQLWRDVLPSGNGAIGAGVYGAVNEERILLNHEDLFWLENLQKMPDMSSELLEVRKLLLENNATEADQVYVNKMREKSYKPNKAIPLPLGDILVNMKTHKPFKNYIRELDMGLGEVTVSWEDGDTNFKRKLFVSRADNCVYLKIEKNGSYNIDGHIALDIHDIADAKGEEKSKINLDSLYTFSEDGFVYYSMDNDNNTQFGAVMKVITKGGKTICKNGKIELDSVEELTAVIKVFVDSEREKQFPILKSQIEMLDMDYDKSLAKHEIIHREMFEKMTLNLSAETSGTSNEELLLQAYSGKTSNELIEKMWAYGRYMLVSCTGRGGQPCPMYGLWCGSYNAMFSFIMCNENIQMIYWQAMSGNLPELLLSLFELLERQMDDYRENARTTYNCRGINVSAPITPRSGLCTSVQAHILHWTGGASWLSQHYFDYYLYTGDKEFLKTRAMPFMYEAALFYEDFLIKDENGKFMSIPSNSPENTPKNNLQFVKQGRSMETAINATMDFAILKELLTNLIKASEITGLYEEKVLLWKDMISCIPEYQINKDGAIKEWMHPFFEDNYEHRHESHLYPAFPGYEVTKETNPKIFEACLTALKKRRDVGLSSQSGWSLTHMANAFARLECGDESFECLEVLLRTCVNSNLFTFHNDWRSMGAALSEPLPTPVQLDANMGFVSAVQEMIFYSKEDTIKLLPALPKQFSKGSFNSMLAKGGIKVSCEWDMEKEYIKADFVSPIDCERLIKIPKEIKLISCNTKSSKKDLLLIQLEKNKKIKLIFQNNI